MTANPYSRVYWRIRDEYPEIFQDEAALGTWLRLLIIAEGAHPSAGDLPRRVKQGALAKLVGAELVTLLPGDRFQIKGLEAERTRRSEAGRIGGLASGRSRIPTTTAERPFDVRQRPVNLDETRRDEQRKDEQRRAGRENGLKPIAELLPGVVERLVQ